MRIPPYFTQLMVPRGQEHISGLVAQMIRLIYEGWFVENLQILKAQLKCLHIRSDVFQSLSGSWSCVCAATSLPPRWLGYTLYCADTQTQLHKSDMFCTVDAREEWALRHTSDKRIQTEKCVVRVFLFFCLNVIVSSWWWPCWRPTTEQKGAWLMYCLGGSSDPHMQSLFTLCRVREPGQHLCLFHRSPGMKAVVWTCCALAQKSRKKQRQTHRGRDERMWERNWARKRERGANWY